MCRTPPCMHRYNAASAVTPVQAQPRAHFVVMSISASLRVSLATLLLPLGAAASDIATIKSPVTGRLWMDRNLGAERVAENPMDDHAFGSIYRWNRAKAYVGNAIHDVAKWDPESWGDESIDLKPGVLEGKKVEWSDEGWQAANNPCPKGFDIPTKAEWEAEKIANAADAFDKLRLPMAMYRALEGQTQGMGFEVREDRSYAPAQGAYWSRTTQGDVFFYYLKTDAKAANLNFVGRAYGFSMRCIKKPWSLFGG